MEGNLWQTWTESKSREDGGALKKTEPTTQLCVSGWSGLRGWRQGDGTSQEDTSWGDCMGESGRGDGKYTYISEAKRKGA